MKLSFVYKRAVLIVSLPILICSCAQLTPQPSVYDQSSWKKIVPSACEAFFDGCNNCRRSSGSDLVACTRKACSEYKKPVCLDDFK